MTHPHTFAHPTAATWSKMDTATRRVAIRVLASQGLTGGDIAAQLDTTRNAVLGVAHRAGISIGGGVSRMPRQPDQGRVAAPAFRVLPPVPDSAWAPLAPPVAEPTRCQCCWPVGLEGGAKQMFCGLPRRRGSYCGDHADLATRPANPDPNWRVIAERPLEPEVTPEEAFDLVLGRKRERVK